MQSVDGVLIAGGGAVGLTAALSLAQKGVPVTVLEAEPELVKEFRASSFHPPTLEMLDELGVGTSLIAKGVVADKVQIRDRKEGLLAEFDLGMLKDYTRYPFRLQIDQYALSVLLFEQLQRMPNAEIKFHYKVIDVTLAAHHVIVTAETAEGPQQFRVLYVIGADGGNSAVRRALDIKFEGMTYPNRYVTLFTTFDFAKHLPGFAAVNYVADPEEWFILLRNPHVWRVLFPDQSGQMEEDILRDEAIQPRLQGIVATGKPYPIVHRRLYKVHQRVAKTYRKGRVLLAGDAAHVNNPTGGMGLNGGIHDAVNLSEKLAQVWQGNARDEILNVYASERRRITIEHIQAQTHQNALVLSEKDPAARKQQYDNLRRIAADPKLALEYMLQSSMITSLRSQKLL